LANVVIDALRDDSGRLIGFAKITRDVTERVRAAQELEEARIDLVRSRAEEALRRVQAELAHVARVATLGELTVSIAHEVNQPITASVINARAALRWLAARPPVLEEARRALARIVEDSLRAGGIIGRVRDLMKKAPPRADRLDINDAIREVIQLARAEAVKNNVSVRTEFADSLPFVTGDRAELQQVVLNLIVNAVEAMSTVPDGPREMLIRSARAGLDVLVTVQDSGPGLPAEDPERIFESFYTTKPNGLGMGLSISRSIIEAHGGRLWASANAPRGAVFQFAVSAVDRVKAAGPNGSRCTCCAIASRRISWKWNRYSNYSGSASPRRHSANGERSPFWRSSGATGSPRPASSTDRSTA
jgi:C4-dicarboxylate-specific signal transduction histidine kinase